MKDGNWWEQSLQLSLKRKNSRLRNCPRGLMEALRSDLAGIAGCPRRPPIDEVKPAKGQNSKRQVTTSDRKFAHDIGVKIDVDD